jgi:hypothetical protein
MSGSIGDNPYRASGVVAAAGGAGGISWQSVVTASTLSAEAGNGYPINTTSNACTVTLPAGTVGDIIEFTDYAGTWDSNAVTLTTTEKIKGSDGDGVLKIERQGIRIVYVDATQGWEAVSGVNETAPAINPPSYSIEFLIVAGGGGGGDAGYGGGAGAGGYIESTQTVDSGFVITCDVGGGGAGGTGPAGFGANGENSSVTGSGLTDQTAIGGGTGGPKDSESGAGESGGSGGGSKSADPGGEGTAEQGNDGGAGYEGAPNHANGGGGGASAVGGNATSTTGGSGGAGTANNIVLDSTPVTYAGGGGGGTHAGGTGGEGGAGGGGDAGAGGGDNDGAAGDPNTGGGGGGPSYSSTPPDGGVGGSGIIVLRMLTADYSGTITGSPTESTDGDYKVLKYTGDGTYTT